MKILLVTTGGTIGSVVKHKVVDVENHSTALIVNKYRQMYPCDDCEFDVISPVNILSENMSKSVWEKIVNTLITSDLREYDGVIVTHGSDTLAYTSALLGLVTGNCNKPVIIVAADKPVEDARSNGVANFRCAVDIIKNGINGVFVPYRNSDGVMYIHYGVDLCESNVLSDDFHSAFAPFAIYENGNIILSDTKRELPKIPQGVFDAPITLCHDVLQIMPYPAIDYSRYLLDDTKAVMLRLYHAGTACADGEYKNKVDCLLDSCNKKGIKLYLCSARSGANEYDSLHKLKQSGAQVLYDIAPPCAYMKLLLACNQDKMSIEEFMGC